MKQLSQINVKNLILNQNAYLYKKVAKVETPVIKQVFNQALQHKNGRKEYEFIIRKPYTWGKQESALYSICIFSFTKSPTFLKSPEEDKLEVKFGFLLIIEYQHYLSIIRKNISGIDLLNLYIEPIDYEILSNFLITKDSKFEKVKSERMHAVNTVQRKTSEGLDLKHTYSMYGASKEILNALQIDNNGEKVSISLNTSRINTFKFKTNFYAILDWLIQVLLNVNMAFQNRPKSPFLNGFAQPIKFKEVAKRIIPTYLSLRLWSLKDDLDTNIDYCYQIDEEGNQIRLNDINQVLSNYEGIMELDPITPNKYEGKGFTVRINQKSISLNHEELRNTYLVFYDERTMSLLQYINAEGAFMINFDQPEYVYHHKRIFKDSQLLGNLDIFYNTFQPNNKLILVTSEKGNNYTPTTQQFSSDSIFHFIESEFGPQTTIMICDDYGTEWGDFIAIDSEEIIFYHAKYAKKSLSASKLEEVFGQITKNLGYLVLNEDMIETRKNRWLDTYRHKKVKTQINRIRKVPIAHHDKIYLIHEIARQANNNPYVRKKMYAVINFLSLSELKQSIALLQKGQKFVHRGVTLQILWFVNAMVANALDQDVEFRIICMP